jgi:hypothetical protein
MKQFAFISRHTPTSEQIKIAAEKGIELISIGDRDAFTVTPSDIENAGDFDGVVVVHPAAALSLISTFTIGVFENAIRPAEGDRPTFYAKALHLYYFNTSITTDRKYYYR